SSDEDDPLRTEINWPMAGLSLAAGIGLVVLGLGFGGFGRDAWSSVLINVGTAVGLVVVLVLLEQRVLRRASTVAQQAARDTVRRETADLRNRVTRLENLDDGQADERVRRRQATRDALQRLQDEELTVSALGEVLAYAHEQQLFGESFRVRTS